MSVPQTLSQVSTILFSAVGKVVRLPYLSHLVVPFPNFFVATSGLSTTLMACKLVDGLIINRLIQSGQSLLFALESYNPYSNHPFIPTQYRVI